MPPPPPNPEGPAASPDLKCEHNLLLGALDNAESQHLVNFELFIKRTARHVHGLGNSVRKWRRLRPSVTKASFRLAVR